MSDKNYYGYRGHAGYRRGGESSDGGLFGWTVFIFLLIGLVFLCWMGSYYIFARPEKAANYRLLQRLHKLEPPQRFEITAAPRGEFLKPSQLLERFGPMTPGEIRRANETLLRSFIRNYHQNRELVPYAVGTYRVIGTQILSDQTFCSSGCVALLQAVEQPEVLLEQLFTASEENLPALQKALQPGQDIKLEKPLDLSAIVHIDHLPDNRIKLTTMPLLYGSYGSGKGPASFSLEPPFSLNLEAGLPVVKAAEIEHLAGGKLALAKNEAKASHLKRITEETPTPTPEPSIAKALPVHTPLPGQQTAASSDSEPNVARAIPVNVPSVLPAIPVNSPRVQAATPASTPLAVALPTASAPTATPEVVEATPTPTPKPMASPAVAAAPVLPTTAPVLTNGLATATNASPLPGGAWPIYAPGKMPRGALLDPSESVELASHGTPRERHYLRGHFAVTASGNGKAVLRPESALAGLALGPNSKIRVIVEYPPGAEPPTEGKVITRDSLRPFQITSVKRGNDGQVNVYAREVTRSE